MEALILLFLAFMSGVFGRMGGSDKYDTKWRDVCCSLIAVLGCVLFFGWNTAFWWVYLLIFTLHWAAFTTYYDVIFGYDNLWFSGFMVGIAIFPMAIIDKSFWPVIIARGLILCVIWGCLNKFLPEKVLCWRRDVAEEFSRYFVSL